MKKEKIKSVLKILFTILIIVSVAGGTVSVVNIISNRKAAGELLDEQSDLPDIFFQKYEKEESLEKKAKEIYLESNEFQQLYSYYENALKDYMLIRGELNIHYSLDELNMQASLLRENGTSSYLEYSSVAGLDYSSGPVYEDLQYEYNMMLKQLSNPGYWYHPEEPESGEAYSETVNGSLNQWNKVKECLISGENNQGNSNGKRYVLAWSKDRNGRKICQWKKFSRALSGMLQCYGFYQQLFHGTESNFTYQILGHNANAEMTQEKYDVWKEDEFYAIYDPVCGYAKENPFTTIDDLRGMTRYASLVARKALNMENGSYDNINRLGIEVHLDTDYGANDVFKQQEEFFCKRYVQAYKGLKNFAIYAIMALVSFIALLILCGRKEEVEALENTQKGKRKYHYVLKGLDNFFTEFYVVLLLMCISSFFFTMEELIWYSGEIKSSQMDIIFEIALSSLVLLGIWLFLELVKKIKARKFLAHTVLGKIIHSLRSKTGKLYGRISRINAWCKNVGEDSQGVKKILVFDGVRLLCLGGGFVAILAADYSYSDFGMVFGILLAFGCMVFYLYQTVMFRKWVVESRAADRRMLEGLQIIAGGDLEYQLVDEKASQFRQEMITQINQIREGLAKAVEKEIKSERMKTELITNVSHDIKTPLTSIINYVDLLKRENLDNEKAVQYIGILEEKSQRLKVLIEDLVEASKASSGAIHLEYQKLNFNELVNQTNGEFTEKFEHSRLTLVSELSEEALVIEGDGRRIYRILENLYQNVCKYSLEGTRVYVSLKKEGNKAVFQIKNISRDPLNISADELTERFVRGDESRTTEGSGLGLSIAKSLTELQKGIFCIYLDGDLFRVTIAFPLV